MRPETMPPSSPARLIIPKWKTRKLRCLRTCAWIAAFITFDFSPLTFYFTPVSVSVTPRLGLTPDQREQLLAAARQAMQNAYAPYSGFKVGAALLTSDDRVFTGCNVENASYGLTICAERNAIFAAVAATPAETPLRIRAIAVLNSQERACSPCGACRQVIAEFGPDAAVLFQGQAGIRESTLKTLLPDSFSF